jgi:hypothetical protein
MPETLSDFITRWRTELVVIEACELDTRGELIETMSTMLGELERFEK